MNISDVCAHAAQRLIQKTQLNENPYFLQRISLNHADRTLCTSSYKLYSEYLLTFPGINPYLHLLLKLISSQVNDASWFGLYLSSTLLYQITGGNTGDGLSFRSSLKIPIDYIRLGVQKASDYSIEWISGKSSPIENRHLLNYFNLNEASEECVLALIHSVRLSVGGLVSCSRYEEKCCERSILEAYMYFTMSNASGVADMDSTAALFNQNANGMNIIYHTVPGYNIDQCQCLTNSIWMSIPVPTSLQNASKTTGKFSAKLSNCLLKVICFNESMEYPSFASDDQIEYIYTSGEVYSKLSGVEKRYLLSVKNLLLKSGVNVVVCQKRIHPYLQHICAANNILCIPRLSIRYMEAVQKLSGGVILGNLSSLVSEGTPSIHSSYLGVITSITSEMKFNQSYVCMVGVDDGNTKRTSDTDAGGVLEAIRLNYQPQSVCTVFITSLLESDLEELRGGFECTLNTIYRTYANQQNNAQNSLWIAKEWPYQLGTYLEEVAKRDHCDVYCKRIILLYANIVKNSCCSRGTESAMFETKKNDLLLVNVSNYVDMFKNVRYCISTLLNIDDVISV